MMNLYATQLGEIVFFKPWPPTVPHLFSYL